MRPKCWAGPQVTSQVTEIRGQLGIRQQSRGWHCSYTGEHTEPQECSRVHLSPSIITAGPSLILKVPQSGHQPFSQLPSLVLEKRDQLRVAASLHGSRACSPDGTFTATCGHILSPMSVLSHLQSTAFRTLAKSNARSKIHLVSRNDLSWFFLHVQPGQQFFYSRVQKNPLEQSHHADLSLTLQERSASNLPSHTWRQDTPLR